MINLEKMINLARIAVENAYAPYSKFPVGAVVMGTSGNLYVGCNVENAAYPSGSCAEQSAIAAMVAAGETEIEAILVMGKGENLVSPCGACRQRIREFAKKNIPVYICGLDGVRKETTIEELLPYSFGPQNLDLK
ncbi:MAG: cytidine deaminase [Alphaproteobacteria bacterium]